jgi:hypothetical protein
VHGTHPGFDRAKRMLDRLPPLAHLIASEHADRQAFICILRIVAAFFVRSKNLWLYDTTFLVVRYNFLVAINGCAPLRPITKAVSIVVHSELAVCRALNVKTASPKMLFCRFHRTAAMAAGSSSHPSILALSYLLALWYLLNFWSLDIDIKGNFQLQKLALANPKGLQDCSLA